MAIYCKKHGNRGFCLDCAKEKREAEQNSASVACYATGMPVRFLKSGSLCEFVEYLHRGQCRIKRADTGKEMIATLEGIEVAVNCRRKEWLQFD